MKFSKHHFVLSLFSLFALSFIFLFHDSGYLLNLILINLAFYLVILYVGVTRYRFNYFAPAIHSGNQEGIALTFDDGPNPDFTNKILDILKKHEAKATFFIIGKNIEGNEGILKRVVDENHIVANHSFAHTNFYNSYKPSKIIADMDSCAALVENITQKKVRFFRSPFGIMSPNIAKALQKTEYIAVGWDFRTFDTMAKSETKLLNKMKKKAKTSSILLMHDNNEITCNVLDAFLSFCSENGIKVVSLDKMIGLKPYKD